MEDERRKAAIREDLAAARRELLDLYGRLSTSQLETIVYADGGEWRVADLLRHLMSAERDMGRLIDNIREGGEGASADFDLNRWNASRVARSRNKAVPELLAEMAENRIELLEMLATTTDEELDRRGRHGSLRILSVEDIFALIADHERRHLLDIRRAVGN
jgi:hypothetical protein